MSRKQLSFLSVGLAGLMISGMWATAQVQGTADELVRMQDVKLAKVETPKYEVKKNIPSVSTATREQNWVELSLLYKTAPEWMDEVTVTFYVLLEPKEDPSVKYKLLTGTVSYVNVKKGAHRSVMYLHPTTLERYGEPKRCAAVLSASYKGRPMEFASEEKPWWKQLAGEPGLVLDRMQTPFAMLNFTDFEAIKVVPENK